ncbi:MAG TPA: HIT family protein [Rhizomicrobium sp.]|jgi:diadenosine tetraphosphate (Ap4A) HIT family hydrolase|nr:HIT family protein [Rhizomicrobium sp.]
MSDFKLHPRLEADTAFVTDLPLCRVLAMNDARYPWLILVPRREATELHDLNARDRALLIEQIALTSAKLKSLTNAAKINVGALGNLVPQLHIHIVARNPGDAAWPGPVWGHGAPIPYAPDALKAFVKDVGTAIAP